MRTLALFSTWDKEGIGSLARALVAQGMECVATGNTKTLLEKEGIPVLDISEVTGEPERFGGRVKTLHHKIFGGILFRPGQDESEWPEDFRVGAVVCNFYPFEEKTRDAQAVGDLIEWIDIGGPSMVRAAAKNHAHVWVFTKSAQYSRYIAAPDLQDPPTALRLRERFAREAFEYVRDLDESIAQNFRWKSMGSTQGGGALTYGENPHQAATFTSVPESGITFVGALSYNNIRDAEGAFRFVASFKAPAVSVVKHQTLCGAAAGMAEALPSQVFRWAWEGDPVSRFGGILGFNFLPGQEIQEVLRKKFLEVIVLPRTPGAERLAADLQAVKPKLRFVLVDPTVYERSLQGDFSATPTWERWKGTLGELRQQPDGIPFHSETDLQDAEQHFHRFGQWAAACSKSNAMIVAGHDATSKVSYLAGTGQGQPNRLDALQRLAIPRARDFCERTQVPMKDLTCFSDAFLSHVDSITALREAGMRRLVQPGGSKADAEVQTAAQEAGIEMILTGRRHFWH